MFLEPFDLLGNAVQRAQDFVHPAIVAECLVLVDDFWNQPVDDNLYVELLCLENRLDLTTLDKIEKQCTEEGILLYLTTLDKIEKQCTEEGILLIGQLVLMIFNFSEDLVDQQA